MNVSALEKKDMTTSDYSSADILSATEACCYKNSPLRWVHSKEAFQQLCTVSSGRKKKSRWESQLQCSSSENEATGQ